MSKHILNKSTRTSIMYGVIICLLVGIVVCIVRITIRPKVEKPEEFNLSVLNTIDDDEVIEVVDKKEQVHIEVHDRARITEDNINVRSGPSTDYERLGTAYRGFDFEILDSSSDWIKIKYDDKEAYIYSEFVEIVPMFLNDMGEYEEYVEFDNSTSSSEDTDIDDASDVEDTEETSEDN